MSGTVVDPNNIAQVQVAAPTQSSTNCYSDKTDDIGRWSLHEQKPLNFDPKTSVLVWLAMAFNGDGFTNVAYVVFADFRYLNDRTTWTMVYDQASAGNADVASFPAGQKVQFSKGTVGNWDSGTVRTLHAPLGMCFAAITITRGWRLDTVTVECRDPFQPTRPADVQQMLSCDSDNDRCHITHCSGPGDNYSCSKNNGCAQQTYRGPTPGYFVNDIEIWYRDQGGYNNGVRNFGNVWLSDLSKAAQTFATLDRGSCCQGVYLANTYELAGCQLANLVPTNTAGVANPNCTAFLNTYCLQNMDKPACKSYCASANCDSIIASYCQWRKQVQGIDVVVKDQTCACFMDAVEPDFYTNFFNSLQTANPALAQSLPKFPSCFYPQCASSPLQRHYNPPVACPSVTACINVTNVNNNGTIQGGVKLNQNTQCSSSTTNQTTTPSPSGGGATTTPGGGGAGTATQKPTTTPSGGGAAAIITGGHSHTFMVLIIVAIVLVLGLGAFAYFRKKRASASGRPAGPTRSSSQTQTLVQPAAASHLFYYY